MITDGPEFKNISAMGHTFGKDMICWKLSTGGAQWVKREKMRPLTKAERMIIAAGGTVERRKVDRWIKLYPKKGRKPCGVTLFEHQSNPKPCPNSGSRCTRGVR